MSGRLRQVTLGGGYGRSTLDRANGKVGLNLVRSNANWVGQLCYDLTAG